MREQGRTVHRSEAIVRKKRQGRRERERQTDTGRQKEKRRESVNRDRKKRKYRLNKKNFGYLILLI